MAFKLVKCDKCASLFEHPAEVPLPEAKVYCRVCSHKIEEAIAGRLQQLTGKPYGGVTIIDGKLIARQEGELARG